MFGHIYELVIILAIGLIIFGPEKLPEVAANAGKMVRELRDLVDTAMNPHDTSVPEDFSQYYHESLARAGEEVPAGDEDVAMEIDKEGFYHYEIEPEDPNEVGEIVTPEHVHNWEDPPEVTSWPEEEDLETEPAPPHQA